MTLSLRQRIVGDRGDPAAVLASANNQEMQLRGFDSNAPSTIRSSLRFRPLKAIVPLMHGKRAEVKVPAGGLKDQSMHGLIAFGFKTHQIVKSQYAINNSTGVVRIGEDHAGVHEVLPKAIGIIHTKPVSGDYIEMARTIRANGKGKGHIHVPGDHLDGLELSDMNISGRFEVNNPKLRGGITVKGAGQPLVHDPIGPFKVDGISIGAMALSASRGLTDEVFDPTHGLNGNKHPDAASLVHHVPLGSAHGVRTAFSQKAAAAAHAGPFQGYVRGKKLEGLHA